jgi:plastocyanin
MTLVHRTWRLVLAIGLLLVAAGAALPTLAKGGDVSIVDKSFVPTRIVVAQGETVTWTVTKSIGEQHSVTSGKPGADAGKEFDSGIQGLQNDGQSWPFRFDKPGTYDYFCQVHPAQMTGQVIVLAPGESAPTASEGPTASEPPAAVEEHEPIAPERKLIAAGILAATLIVLFGAAWVWRRMNPA